jgi:hypothetical protein
MLGTFYSKSESCELVWAFDVEKYLAWYANNLAPTISAENAKLLNPRALIQAQINVLEDLFGAEWFNHAHRSARPHPAFERWLLCQDFLRRGGRVHIPLDTDRILAFLDVMIDNSSLVEVTGGDWARSLLGDLANYGDAAVSRRLRSIIGNGDQFLDTLLEISTAAWHSSKGHWVEATEDPGRPDIRIVIPEWDYPVLADCKRVSRRANDRRFKKLVEKVSRQVRNAGQAAYGIGYFDISSRVSPLYTGDARPPEVVQVEELVQRQMRLHHRCVSAVVLLWKQHRVLPLTGGPVGVACYLLQRSTIVRHERPHYRLPFETSPVLKASTAAVKVFAE